MHADDRDDATLHTHDGRHVIRFERRLRQPPERVWAALTQPARMREWWADADVELREGGAVELRWQNTDDEGRGAVARGTITALRPPTLVEYDVDPHGRLRFELHEAGDGTLLTFTVSLAAPNDQLDLAMAGWHIHLEHLADALDGGAVQWPTWADDHFGRWSAHRARYAALSGACAARAGDR